jgi:hypothetical protein
VPGTDGDVCGGYPKFIAAGVDDGHAGVTLLDLTVLGSEEGIGGKSTNCDASGCRGYICAGGDWGGCQFGLGLRVFAGGVLISS